MVSTRQMSITTVGPETGSSGVNTNSGSNRMTSNSLNQQNNSARQQANNSLVNSALGDAIQSNAAGSGGGGNSNGSSSNVGGGGTGAGAVVPAHQKQLTDMPGEIFERIFQYTGYKEVSNMRLVSTQMNQICKTILNSTFTKLQTQLMKRFQNIKKIMPRRESARRSHPLSYECDIIDTCCMRLSLLQMTFGRYIEHKHICFFPGAFLDEVYTVLNYIRTTPNPICRPYKITEELIDLSTMAMEYFKDHLEPSMPQFAVLSKDFFGKSSTTARTSPKNCYLFDTASSSSSATAAAAANSVSISTRSSQSSSMPSPPQSNMVLRKGIRKIKQGMKKYNNQLSVLRTDLRFCKRKSTDQAKQITELQNMLAEQQKQTLEYANRLDENDKKSDEMSSKISTLLQELNKCKIELHYYRSKSPATPICNNCGQTTLTIPPGNLLALMKQNINNSREEIFNVLGKCNNLESKVQSHESCISQDLTTTTTTTTTTTNTNTNATPSASASAAAATVNETASSTSIQSTPATPIAATLVATPNKSNLTNLTLLMQTDDNKDALKSIYETSANVMNLTPDIIDSEFWRAAAAAAAAATSGPTVGNSTINLMTTPVNSRDGGLDSSDKRWKLARNKIIQMAAVDDWHCSTFDESNAVPSSSSSSTVCGSSTISSSAATASSSATAIDTPSPHVVDTLTAKKSSNSSSVILTVGTPRFYGKRKLDEHNTIDQFNDAPMTMPNATTVNSNATNNPIATSTITNKTNNNSNSNNATATNNLANSNLSDNYNKKARRVQNKLKIQTNNINIKTRNK